MKALDDADKRHINDLCYQLNYTVSQLSVILFNMELKGLIKALPGDSYAAL